MPENTFEQKLHARITVTAVDQEQAEEYADLALSSLIDFAHHQITLSADESGLFLDEVTDEDPNLRGTWTDPSDPSDYRVPS
jgi:hypothetical protein